MKQILTLVICGLALSATALADSNQLVYQTLSTLLQNRTPTVAGNGNELKIDGVNDRGDSCELTLTQSLEKSDSKIGNTIRYSFHLSFDNTGDKSGYIYYTLNENPDSPRNQAAYDFATPIEGIMLVSSDGKVSSTSIPRNIGEVDFYTLGYNQLWTTSQMIANKLILVQIANPKYSGGRTIELELSADGKSVTSETIISQKTNSVYTCKFNDSSSVSQPQLR